MIHNSSKKKVAHDIVKLTVYGELYAQTTCMYKVHCSEILERLTQEISNVRYPEVFSLGCLLGSVIE